GTRRAGARLGGDAGARHRRLRVHPGIADHDPGQGRAHAVLCAAASGPTRRPLTRVRPPAYARAMRSLVLALLLVLFYTPGATAAPAGECRRSCKSAKKACVGAARTLKQRLRGECASSGATRRPCLKAAGEIAGGARRSCAPFGRTCRACCTQGGVDCT